MFKFCIDRVFSLLSITDSSYFFGNIGLIDCKKKENSVSKGKFRASY